MRNDGLLENFRTLLAQKNWVIVGFEKSHPVTGGCPAFLPVLRENLIKFGRGFASERVTVSRRYIDEFECKFLPATSPSEWALKIRLTALSRFQVPILLVVQTLRLGYSMRLTIYALLASTPPNGVIGSWKNRVDQFRPHVA